MTTVVWCEGYYDTCIIERCTQAQEKQASKQTKNNLTWSATSERLSCAVWPPAPGTESVRIPGRVLSSGTAGR